MLDTTQNNDIEGQSSSEAQDSIAFDVTYTQDTPTLVMFIKELHKQRVDLMRAKQRLTLQMKAICRRVCDGDKDQADKLFAKVEKGMASMEGLGVIQPLMQARDMIQNPLTLAEKELDKAAKHTPLKGFVKDTLGVSWGTVAAIVGEASGDNFLGLSDFANPAKVWKRFGLGLVDGERQHRTTDKEKAIAMGYSPYRRSLIYVMGTCIIKAQVRKDPEDEEKRIPIGIYGKVYLDRKQYELQRDPECTPMKAHMRAQRYMEKRVLRDMWRAWRDTTAPTESN